VPPPASAPEVREVREEVLREDAPREQATVEAPAPAPKRRGRPLKNEETAAIAAPEPEPKLQRKTPAEAPPAAVVGVGMASHGAVSIQGAGDTQVAEGA